MLDEKTTLTPLMRQYYAIKNQYPDTLLLFQVGDFYELFFDDAKQAAAFLGIALTKRGKVNGEPIPLCGVPVHALDYYLIKLIKGGFKVALCDQLEQAVPGKVVERGVTQVLTPGTLTDPKLLEDKKASFLCALFPGAQGWAVLFAELMTAQLYATTLPADNIKTLESELSKFFPDEIVMPHTDEAKKIQQTIKQLGYFTSFNHQDIEDLAVCNEVDVWMMRQFSGEVTNVVEGNTALRNALRTFYSYVQRNQRAALDQFNTIEFYKADDFLLLDGATQRNLELIKNAHDGSKKNSLFDHIDRAVTGMGSRMIKKWLVRPLTNHEAIEQRLDAVELLVRDAHYRQALEHDLSAMGDIERVIGRIALARAPLSDYVTLTQSLAVMPHIKDLLNAHQHMVLIRVLLDHMPDFYLLQSLLTAAIHDDPSKDWLIKRGFDQHLDALRELALNSDQKIVDLERKEQEITGKSSLKIRYNQVHGYYIELTKIGARTVPDYYVRQQTLVGKERFMTPELRMLQDEIMYARQEVDLVEKKVFERIKQEVATYIPALRKATYALAHLDALIGFARCAYDYGYVRPTFNQERVISIDEGRHPVIEASGSRFIPNSTTLSDNQRLWIITGPNMGGKSTYLRQVALISIMGQCGSFVPARAASLALLDRVFTRIGAGDNLAEGKSTFLVEMEETAMICTQATERSLVILDEVGRGTSTFDGLAIAQAVVEYIYTSVKARCLFATHYHELTALQDQYEGVKSYYAASKKTPHGILFLYKMVEGAADGSFGIEVARLAQLPVVVLHRAQEILHDLTKSETGLSKPHNKQGKEQMSLFLPAQQEHEFLLEKRLQEQEQELNRLKSKLSLLERIDYNELSPKQAFDLLWHLKDSN